MQLFMQDDGVAEAEAAARADLHKHLRVHFAAGDPSATGACGLVSVLQRGLCAYATWHSAVSKVTAGKEPCGAVLQLSRLVRRVQPRTPPPSDDAGCLWRREGVEGAGGGSGAQFGGRCVGKGACVCIHMHGHMISCLLHTSSWATPGMRDRIPRRAPQSGGICGGTEC